MKKLILIMFSALVFVSCDSDSQKEAEALLEESQIKQTDNKSARLNFMDKASQTTDDVDALFMHVLHVNIEASLATMATNFHSPGDKMSETNTKDHLRKLEASIKKTDEMEASVQKSMTELKAIAANDSWMLSAYSKIEEYLKYNKSVIHVEAKRDQAVKANDAEQTDLLNRAKLIAEEKKEAAMKDWHDFKMNYYYGDSQKTQ